MSRRRWAWVAAGAWASFIALTALVMAGSVPGDAAALQGSPVDGAARTWARCVDRATDTLPLALVLIGVVAVLLRRGSSRTAVVAAVAFGGAVLLNPLWKRLVDRPRPPALPADADVSALAFPSGHAVSSAALALAVLLAAAGTRWMAAAVVASAALVAGSAVVQVALAQHRPSDLVAGGLWAIAWSATVAAVVLRPARAAGRAQTSSPRFPLR